MHTASPLRQPSLTHTYRSDLNCHVLPTFGDRTFADVTVPALEAFRATLLNRETGKGLAVKTARCIIDGTLRALYRDARKDGHAAGDPFAELAWPRKAPPDIDPFDEAERDTLLSHFRDRDRFWFPFVHTAFWRRALRATEMRPRKFYATRHTFISLAMTKGMPLKLVATYCGTSVEMIEQHYGKWLSDDMGRWLEHVTAKPASDGAIAAQNP